MRALVVDGAGRLRLETDRRRPEPGPGQALIRVRLAGICQTDMELVKGYMNFQGVLGHEFVGVVEEADGDTFRHGERVVGGINIRCGRCDMCRRGLGRHCRRVRVLGISNWDGAFADWMVLPEENLESVPDTVSDRQAVFVEPLAAAVEILEQVHVKPDDLVAVVGDGRLGLLCAQVLARTGCHVRVIGRHRDKLAVVEGHSNIVTLLAQEVARKGDNGTLDVSAEWAGQFDVVVEATGRSGGLDLARQLVRPRGTLVLKTTIHASVPFNVADIVVREITVVGSRCGPFAPALTLLGQGDIVTEPLIHGEYDLSDAVRAFEHAQRPGTLKVLIRCSPESSGDRGRRAAGPF